MPFLFCRLYENFSRFICKATLGLVWKLEMCPTARNFFARQGDLTRQYFVYCKENQRSMAEKEPPFGYIDIFQTWPKPSWAIRSAQEHGTCRGSWRFPYHFRLPRRGEKIANLTFCCAGHSKKACGEVFVHRRPLTFLYSAYATEGSRLFAAKNTLTFSTLKPKK